MSMFRLQAYIITRFVKSASIYLIGESENNDHYCQKRVQSTHQRVGFLKEASEFDMVTEMSNPDKLFLQLIPKQCRMERWTVISDLYNE